jgi:hypothetical protein
MRLRKVHRLRAEVVWVFLIALGSRQVACPQGRCCLFFGRVSVIDGSAVRYLRKREGRAGKFEGFLGWGETGTSKGEGGEHRLPCERLADSSNNGANARAKPTTTQIASHTQSNQVSPEPKTWGRARSCEKRDKNRARRRHRRRRSARKRQKKKGRPAVASLSNPPPPPILHALTAPIHSILLRCLLLLLVPLLHQPATQPPAPASPHLPARQRRRRKRQEDARAEVE